MELLQSGVGCTVIALWLGHESAETTHVYLHADMQIKKQAARAVRPRRWIGQGRWKCPRESTGPTTSCWRSSTPFDLFYADNPTGATRSVNGLGRTVGIKRLSAYARSCRYRHDRAERDLRMSKVKQKVSGCFRTRKYAEAYCRISSYLQSMANQGYNPLVAIQIALAGRAVDNLPE